MPSHAKTYRRSIAAGLILLTASAAYGEEGRQLRLTTQPVSQTVYKGVVGNLLEEVPIDPETRVDLQRGNAVISNTLSGRALALALGITNPVLLVVGLAWGLFSASQIKAPAAQATAAKEGTAAPRAEHEPPANAGIESVDATEDPMFCRGRDGPVAAMPADESIALTR